MIARDDIQSLLSGGATVIGPDGDTIGTVSEFYLDDRTGEPEWVTASTGKLGDAVSFIPLVDGSIVGNAVQVPYVADVVIGSPRFDDATTHLSEQEEADLYSYYGVSFAPVDTQTGSDTDTQASTDMGTQPVSAGLGTGTLPRDTDTRPVDTSSSGLGTSTAPQGTSNAPLDTSSAPLGTTGTRSAAQGSAMPAAPTSRSQSDLESAGLDAAMTRSEEHLHVSTERVPSGTARLHKYVVTEEETVTVPVSHEEVHLEREPITDANRDAALSGPEFAETDYEVTLTAERPVVEKETVPVERVKLVKDTVTGEQTVTESIRTEKIELENQSGSGRSSSGSPTEPSHQPGHRKDDAAT